MENESENIYRQGCISAWVVTTLFGCGVVEYALLAVELSNKGSEWRIDVGLKREKASFCRSAGKLYAND